MHEYDVCIYTIVEKCNSMYPVMKLKSRQQLQRTYHELLPNHQILRMIAQHVRHVIVCLEGVFDATHETQS